VIGAALFSTLPRERSPALLHALATFQAIFDYLDNVNETHPTEANGLTLHIALLDALGDDRPVSDYYRHHPWKGDDGYLTMLVEQCRSCCRLLPSYERLYPLLSREAEHARRVLTLNHLPTEERNSALQHWAEREFRNESDWSWFELCAAASGQLAIFALLALAAEPQVSKEEIEATWAAYWPVLPLVATMLDSFVDQTEDDRNNEHLYVSHYRDSGQCVDRMSELIDHANRAVLGLPNGHRHAVILGCMTTFYLAKRSARVAALKSQRSRLIRAGGSLAQLLAPVLTVWRVAYSQSTA
jgi:tetraprenyl-beta-curcumene synthase